ncbi:MAG: isoprenylcysteine carboxylmethyltransferase family protein [Alkalicoccus sp.]|nr:MAG: isoprenylcysteine carboxylmethyltransferase family protein [Alkalicoccus sp.]
MLDIFFTALSILWILEFFIFRSRLSGEEDEASSFPWLMAAVASIAAVSVVSRETGTAVFSSTILTTAGLFLYGAGIFLRYWGIIHLGRQFTRDVQVREGDRIVSSGPFRRLRHPLYTGLFSIVTGFAVYMGSFAGILLTAVFFLPFLMRRIRLEEEMLIQSFGSSYEKWLKTRYRLVPFIY